VTTAYEYPTNFEPSVSALQSAILYDTGTGREKALSSIGVKGSKPIVFVVSAFLAFIMKTALVLFAASAVTVSSFAPVHQVSRSDASIALEMAKGEKGSKRKAALKVRLCKNGLIYILS